MMTNLHFNQLNAIGKRLAMVLTMLLVVGVGQMKGETATLTFDDTSKRTVGTTTQQVWEENGITFTNNKASSSTNVNTSYYNPIRCYASSSATIECSLGNITKIEVTCSSSSYATIFKNSVGDEGSASGSVVTITPETSSDTYTIKLFTAQTRVSSLTVYYETAAPSYIITAESNNTNYGTVSLSGTTITATPTDGYRVSTTNPYDVTSGTAAVTQSGNTFTVSATADCTVQINFEAIPTHQVHFNTGGLTTITSVDVQEGKTYSITQDPSSSLTSECEYGTFVGWTESSSIADASTKPTLVESVTMSTSDITLYAVYSKTEGGNSTTTNTSSDVTLKDDVYNSSVSTITWTIADVITIKQETNGAQTAVSSSYISAPRWYAGHMITMTPLVNITSIVVTATSESYASELQSSNYTNATASVSSTEVTITPTTGTLPITIVLGKQSRISSITVNYSTSSAGATTYSIDPSCTTETALCAYHNIR